METTTAAPVKLASYRTKPNTGLPTSGIMILVGQPKSGKTTFAATFPASYILELEPSGGSRVDGRIHDIANLAEFRAVLPAVMNERAIRTVVIDTIDVLSDYLEDEVAQASGLTNITERKTGVDGFQLWGAYRQKIESLVGYFKACGKLVILIAHCRDAKMDAAGTVITPSGINMPGKAGSYLAAQADIIGYAYKKQVSTGTAYYLTFQGGPLGTWGSRVAELNDKTLTLPKENPYSAFEAVFAPSIIQQEKELKSVTHKTQKQS